VINSASVIGVVGMIGKPVGNELFMNNRAESRYELFIFISSIMDSKYLLNTSAG
jgi:hypothetical protein